MTLMVEAVQQVVTDLPPFATMTQLVAYSQQRISPTDPTAELMLAAASNMIRRYCGWHIYPSVEFDLVMDGPGGSVLQLPSRYLTDVTSITEGGLLTDSSAYRWSQLGEVERAQPYWMSGRWINWWPLGYRSVEVAFTSGYDEAPPELATMVLGMTARALSSPTGATREQAGQVSVQYALSSQHAAGGLALMANDLEQLDPYRIVGA
jgi:hypothetical protein